MTKGFQITREEIRSVVDQADAIYFADFVLSRFPENKLSKNVLRLLFDCHLSGDYRTIFNSKEFSNYVYDHFGVSLFEFYDLILRNDGAILANDDENFHFHIGKIEKDSLVTILRFLSDSRHKDKFQKPLLITSIRNEGAWLLEWIAHYKSIGIEKIIVYSNNNTDESDLMLDILNRENIITWYPTKTYDGYSPQKRAFAHALWKNPEVAKHEWVMFVDCDEFIDYDHLSDDFTLSSSKFSVADCIALNWIWMSNDETLFWDEGLVTTRFVNGYKHPMKKCIFRPEMTKSISQIHFPEMLSGAAYCDADGNKIHDISIDMIYNTNSSLMLRHYFSKSFEEFLAKRARGRGAVTNSSDIRPLEAFGWGRRLHSNATVYSNFNQTISEYLDALYAINGLIEAETAVREKTRNLVRSEFGDRAGIERLFRSLQY